VGIDKAIYLFPSCGQSFDRNWFKELLRRSDISVGKVETYPDSLLPEDEVAQVDRLFKTRAVSVQRAAARFGKYSFIVEIEDLECLLVSDLRSANPYILLDLWMFKRRADPGLAEAMRLARVIWSCIGPALIVECEDEDPYGMEEYFDCVDGERVLLSEECLRAIESIWVRDGESLPVGVVPEGHERIGNYTRYY
jgi:hypothetical protein